MLTAVLLGLASFLVAFMLTPLCRNIALKFGLVDRPDSKRKLHAAPIPRVGGIAIAIAYAVGIALLLASPHTPTLKVPIASRIAPAAIFIFVAGLVDDLVGLKPWQKLAAQVAAGAIAYWSGIQVHLVNGHSIGWLALPLTVLWLVACANAFNLIDGLDGLAAGIGLFATITVLIAAWLGRNLELAIVTVPLIGALIGFLFYNFNPASIFLGDCGSMLIGFLLGCYGILWSHKSATLLGLTGPLMAVSIPLLDTALTILRRYMRGHPVFQADRGHIHHRLLDRGLSARSVALVMYGFAGVVAILSLLLSVVHDHFAGFVLVLFCGVTWIAVHQLGYVEFSAAGSLVLRGGFRSHLTAHVNLRTLEERLQAAATPEACWSVLRDGCQSFGFHAFELQLDGHQYHENNLDRDGRESWTLQIPLFEDNYIQLRRHFDSQAPAVVAPFASLLRASLQQKAREFRLSAPPAAAEPELTFSGGAAAKAAHV